MGSHHKLHYFFLLSSMALMLAFFSQATFASLDGSFTGTTDSEVQCIGPPDTLKGIKIANISLTATTGTSISIDLSISSTDFSYTGSGTATEVSANTFSFTTNGTLFNCFKHGDQNNGK